MEDIFSFLTELASAPFRRLFTFRGLAIVLAAALSFGVYQLVVSSSLGETLRYKDILPMGIPDEITFYAGSSTGDYAILGEALQKEIEGSENFKVNLDKLRSAGYQNGINVWQDNNSFGLMQRHSFEENDYIFNQIDLVAPVYTEQLHIIVNKEKLKTSLKNYGLTLDAFKGSITLNTDPRILNALLHSGPINIGTYGTGVMWIGSRIIDDWVDKININTASGNTIVINNSTQSYVEIENKDPSILNRTIETSSYNLKEIRESLVKGKAGMAMFMIAPGLKDQAELLANRDRVLPINLEPEYVVYLKDKYNLQVRPTTFHYCNCVQGNKAEDKVEIKSLGTFTYLVTGKGTNMRLTNKIIKGLDQIRKSKKKYFANGLYLEPCHTTGNNTICSENTDTLTKKIGLPFYGQVFFGNDAINFEDIFADRMEQYRSDLFRIIALFIISILVAIIPFYIGMIWLFSGANYWFFLTKINRDVYKKGVPNNIIPLHRKDLKRKRYSIEDDPKIEETLRNNQARGKLLEPFIRADQSIVINNTLLAISNIFKMRDEAYSLLAKGGLTETHHKYLDEEMDQAIGKLRKTLGLRFHELMENKEDHSFWAKILAEDKENKENKEVKKYFLKLTTADYLHREDCERLIKKLEEFNEPKKQAT